MNITLDDVTLYLRDSADATAQQPTRDVPVLLLHGWPDTGELWRSVTPALTAQGYRVLTPDLPGFGASSKPTELEAYALPNVIRRVLGLLDAIAVPAVHLVGHDWGAGIAWLTAALHPGRVRTLTALSVGHPAALRSAGLLQRERSWYMLLFQFPEIAEEWLSANEFANFREWSGHPEPEPVMERFTEGAALTASLGLYRANVSPRTLIEPPPALPPVTVPALVVWSTGDHHLIEEQMIASKDYVTGPWRYARVEDSGHWIPLDAADRLAALLLEIFADAS